MICVMLSVRPQWVENIVNGEKIIEIRKSRPKLETPFKCFIYMTQGKLKELGDYSQWIYENRMKVIGEFICDKIDKFTWSNYEADYRITHTELDEMCLNNVDLIKYGHGQDLYGWHISDLKVYDKPRMLSEFRTPPCEKSEKACEKCKYLVKIDTPDTYEVDCFVENGKELTRPPQSWQFVEIR